MSVKKFISRQLNQIKYKGYIVIYYKLLALIKLIIIFIPALIIVILMRIISPFFLVKIVFLDFSRIGAIYPVFWYLKLKKLKLLDEITSKKSIYLFFFSDNILTHINVQWLSMWKRSLKNLNILPFAAIFKAANAINRFFPGYKQYEFPYDAFIHPYKSRERQAFINSIKKSSLDNITKIEQPVIFFKNEEIKIGENYLKKVGASNNNFICFHSRDSAYYNKYNKSKDWSWSYTNFRNTDIDNYIPALQEMSAKNFLCFRMGAAVKEKLKCSNSKIIDYANSGDRSDLLDIYLSSKCYFFICSESGIAALPRVFDKPIIYLNCIGVDTTHSHANNSLFLPRKIYSTKENRLLSFKEIIKLDLMSKYTTKHLKELNIELIENTQQEIIEAVREMYARLNGTWKSDDVDEILQKKFWSLMNYKFLKSPTHRICSSFLKKNQFLLN